MDDKIYELMAQAEILQEHALELQNKASEATSGIFKTLDQVKRKLLSTALLSAFIWVMTGAIVVLGVYIAIMWSTLGLIDEQDRAQAQLKDLRGKIQDEEKRLAKLRSDGWGIELIEDNGKRWIKLGKGYKAGERGNWKDGRSGIEVIPKK